MKIENLVRYILFSWTNSVVKREEVLGHEWYRNSNYRSEYPVPYTVQRTEILRFGK